MRLSLQITSWIALAATILPSLLYLAGQISLDQSIIWLNVATVFWFTTTPLWMGQPKPT